MYRFPWESCHEWYFDIPLEKRKEMGDAVRSQVFDLPANLLIEWFKPIAIERRWFVEASYYIEIPYPEYWAEQS